MVNKIKFRTTWCNLNFSYSILDPVTHSDPAKPDFAKKNLACQCSHTELNRTTSTPNAFCLLDHTHFLWELRWLEDIILIQKHQCMFEAKKNTQGHGQDETVLVLGPFKKLVRSPCLLKNLNYIYIQKTNSLFLWKYVVKNCKTKEKSTG